LWLFAVLQTRLRRTQAFIDKIVTTQAQLFTWPGHVGPVEDKVALGQVILLVPLTTVSNGSAVLSVSFVYHWHLHNDICC
jgi:hypothetical protein